jgi:hypothetical protein
MSRDLYYLCTTLRVFVALCYMNLCSSVRDYKRCRGTYCRPLRVTLRTEAVCASETLVQRAHLYGFVTPKTTVCSLV